MELLMPENPRGPGTLLRIQNSRDVLINFIFEPVGTIYPMPAGAVFELVAIDQVSEYPDVRVGHDEMVVYCDPRMHLFRDGKRLEPS